MGRPRGSKNKKVTRKMRTRRAVGKGERNEKLSYEESVINLAQCVGVPVKSGVTFGRLVNRVKRVCRRDAAQEVLKGNPRAYNAWVNILIRDAEMNQ